MCALNPARASYQIARARRSGRPIPTGSATLRALATAFWTLLLLGSAGPLRADLLVSSFITGQILRYDDVTGAFVGAFATGLQDDHPLGMTLGPDGNLYVGVNNFGGAQSSFIRRFDGRSGAFLDTFASGGNLSGPHDLVFGPDGNLYVPSFGGISPNSKIIRYNGSTGEFIDDFVPVGSGGLQGAEGLAFGPDVNLYVASRDTNQVLRYDGTTGAFVDVFATIPPAVAQGPVDLAFGPDGNLYVVCGFNPTLSLGKVLRFDGATGDFIDVVEGPSKGGTDASSIVVGPDGKLYVTTGHGASSVRRIDISTGEVSTFVPSFSGGLTFAAGLLFAPQLCDHLGGYGPCAEGAGTRCKAEAVREVGRVVTTLTQVDILECGAADGPGGFEITPDCPAGYSYCVGNRNDGVGNSVKLGIVEPQAIDELVTLSPVQTAFDPTPVPGGPAGTFTITATFTNTSSTPIHHLLFRVARLSGENLLLNADGGPGGVGALLTPDVGSDAILPPNESLTTAFVIGLHLRRQFTFFVDLLGVPEP